MLHTPKLLLFLVLILFLSHKTCIGLVFTIFLLFITFFERHSRWQVNLHYITHINLFIFICNTVKICKIYYLLAAGMATPVLPLVPLCSGAVQFINKPLQIYTIRNDRLGWIQPGPPLRLRVLSNSFHHHLVVCAATIEPDMGTHGSDSWIIPRLEASLKANSETSPSNSLIKGVFDIWNSDNHWQPMGL